MSRKKDHDLLASMAFLDTIARARNVRQNPLGFQFIKLSQWFGLGIDGWVTSTIDALRLALQQHDGSIATLRSCSADTARYFFPFLTEGREAPLLPEPAGFTRMHSDLFVAWLKARDANWENRGGDRTCIGYFRTKSMICRIHKLGKVRAPMYGLWPDNPFPKPAMRCRTRKLLSQAEQQRLAEALKSDLIDLQFDRLKINASEAATVRYAWIAMRTGCRSTALLDATRDALGDGLKRDEKILRLRNSRDKSPDIGGIPKMDAVAIPMDAVAVWQQQLSSTEALREHAPDEVKNSLWLYVSAAGSVLRLSARMMQQNLSRIVERHALKGDDGNPLKLNIMRLRQTFAEKKA